MRHKPNFRVAFQGELGAFSQQAARQLLGDLAVHHVGHNKAMKHRKIEDDTQMDLFADPSKELVKAIAALKLDELTPIQAFDLVRQWKEKFSLPRE